MQYVHASIVWSTISTVVLVSLVVQANLGRLILFCTSIVRSDTSCIGGIEESHLTQTLQCCIRVYM